MHIHLIGVCGTAMGSLAGMLKQAGHRVTGSDAAFYAPMDAALERWGIETTTGFHATNLTPRPDLVIVGNVCRASNPEARAAIDNGIRYTSLPQALEEMYLSQRQPFVIAGTHGKTTTSALTAYLLDRCGVTPGFLVGGIPLDFDESFRAGPINAPFVIEGDEYDTAFFEKKPKFWRYRPHCAVITSLEHDHIDIYPDMESYRGAFDGFVERIDPEGLLIAFAGDPEVRRVAANAPCRVVYYALEQDNAGNVTPTWQAAPVASQGAAQPFDAFIGGSSLGRVLSPLSGDHNIRNALAALAAATEIAGVSARDAITALRGFRGIRRRQELLGVARGVSVYDDFAHHPTAVRETLHALRSRHPRGRLVAVFEPRSATASRQLHQERYPLAFQAADLTLLAPVGRRQIPEEERLDTKAIAMSIRTAGRDAHSCTGVDEIIERLMSYCQADDAIVVMSNGAFDGIQDRLLAALAVGK